MQRSAFCLVLSLVLVGTSLGVTFAASSSDSGTVLLADDPGVPMPPPIPPVSFQLAADPGVPMPPPIPPTQVSLATDPGVPMPPPIPPRSVV